MRDDSVFFDSNVPLYLISGDASKKDRAKVVMSQGGVISTQVLNEFAAIAIQKYKVPWIPVKEALAILKSICRVDPLSIEVHERGIALSERYRFHVYDGLIIAAALIAGCTTLYSEDMQHGQIVEGMTIINPFAKP